MTKQKHWLQVGERLIGGIELAQSDHDQWKISVEERMRPRVYRKLQIPLEWDVRIDSLPSPSLKNASGWFAGICRLYRRIRPAFVGNRCGFEPSCSRFSEMCFRQYGVRKGLVLTVNRLSRCRGENGGLDLPPGIE